MATRQRRSRSRSAQEFASFGISDNVHSAKATASAQLLRPRSANTFNALSAMSPPATPNPDDNVVAVGVGYKVTNGITTGIQAVKVFVRMKYPDDAIADEHRIPAAYDGVAVDVEQIGTVRALKVAAQAANPNPRVKLRPARPGCSVGFLSPLFKMAGTFGAVVKRGSKVFILSNNHVLADENQLPIGSPIVQPGPLDGGKPADVIAKLSEFVRLDPASNTVDAAIAQVSSPSLVDKSILFIGPPTGKTTAAIDMIVQKFGRTTSFRVGRVTSIDTDVRVTYGIGELLFEDQIIVVGLNGEQFSAAGDSGSLILERSTNKAVGLLFAGSSSHTIANHIGNVLTKLNVTLA